MRKSVRWIGGLALGLLFGAIFVAHPRAQVELDRIVARVNGRIITQSDIRQARLLKLVDDVSSDEACRRALENRLLILSELNRAAPVGAAGAGDVDARRSEWQATLGAGANVDDLLRQAVMTDADLQNWIRDDVRIRAYMQRQFGMLGPDERAQATGEWLARLRQRADLPQ